MGVQDIDRSFLEDSSQSQCGENVSGIDEGQFDIRMEGAAAAPGNEDFMAAFAKRFYQLEYMGFATAKVAR